ncbi:MAG: ribonuclease P protein component, partial [Bacteroidales bacterium]
MFTFPKTERLCHRELIRDTLNRGKRLRLGALHASWKIQTSQESIQICKPLQILISIPKRYTKKAVHRNLKKRHLKEAYRKNKQFLLDFLTEENLSLSLTLMYNSKEAINAV